MPKSLREAKTAHRRFWADQRNRPYLYADVVFDDGSYKRCVEFDGNGIAIRLIGPNRTTAAFPELFGRTVSSFCPIRSFTNDQIHQWANISQRIMFAESYGQAILMANVALPPLLVDLMRTNRWVQPDEAVWKRTIPFLDGPVDLLDLDAMEFESQGHLADIHDDWMRQMRSDSNTPSKPLPWLDVSQSFFIAVNSIPGDDIGIALDFRNSDAENPRVVASKWKDNGCEWKLAVSTFRKFVEVTGM